MMDTSFSAIFHQQLFAQAPLGGIEPIKGFVQQQNIRMGRHTQHKFCLPLHPLGKPLMRLLESKPNTLVKFWKRFITEFGVVAL